MSTLAPSRRPWAVTVLAAGLLFLFLVLLVPLAAAVLKFKGPLPVGSVSAMLQGNFMLLAHVLALLIVSPVAAGLILRRRTLGHRLALLLLGYLTIRTAAYVLLPYTWDKFSPLAGLGFLISLINFSINGLLLYLALRPEVFAYTRPAPD